MYISHVCVGAYENQKRMSGFLQMELKAVVCHQMCLLGTELWS